MINPRGGDFYLATSGDRNLAVDRWTYTSGDDRQQLAVVAAHRPTSYKCLNHWSLANLSIMAGAITSAY